MSDIQTIPGALAALREATPPGDRVLSVYLDTSPARVARGGFLLAYRDQCKSLRPDLPEAEREAFERAAGQAEHFLTGEFVPGMAGLALFASGEPGYFFVVPLPERVQERMVWDRRPYLEPLERVLDEGERVGLLLFDARRARLFTLYLGHLTEHQSFADEIPKRQQGGGWATLRQTRYARHREDRLLRHVRRAAAALLALHREQPFDRLLLAGPEEAITFLRHHLPGSLRQRLAGTLRLELFAGPEEILAAARSKVGELERQGEAALVDELIGSATAAHVVLGVGPTLAALAEGRVHHLVVADTFHPAGSECPACGHLDRLAGACAACGAPTQPVADLGERAVELALEQGARVEIVLGDAANLLTFHGGIGAWVRY